MSEIFNTGAAATKQFGENATGLNQKVGSQNGQSFESILQNGKQTGGAPETGNSAVNSVNDPRLEAMRSDLIQRYQTLPSGAPKTSAIFPEFFDTKTRMTNFKNILNQAVENVGNTSKTKDAVGRFAQVENEVIQIDKIMRSDKELSQTELLGLQARLYQVSQHVDVLSKVVDQMTGGVKTILNTNV